MKAIELALMVAAAIGFLMGWGWLLVATLFGMGVQSAFFSPVRIAAMPKYLRKDELVRGNALFNAGLFAAILTGLFLGGVFIERPGGAAVLGVLLVGASFIGWLAVRAAPRAPADAPDLKIDLNAPVQAYRIIRFAVVAPGVFWPLAGAAAFYFASTLVTVLMPIYIKGVWGAGGGVANLMMGLFAIGAGTGALSASLIARSRTGLGAAFFGMFASAGFALAAYVLGAHAPAPTAAEPTALLSIDAFFALPGGVATAAVFFFSSAALGLYMAPIQAAAQRRAPHDKRARIMAAGNMLNAAAAVAGSLSVLAVTNAGVSPNRAILAVAVLQAMICAIMALRWIIFPRGAYEDPGADA